MAESVENVVDSNGGKHNDLTSLFIPSDNAERHKRYIEDWAKDFSSRKGILTVLLHALILYVILNMALL